MSTYEQRDNSGSLFKNDRREKETHANAKGKAMIDGVMYYVDAWTKKDKNGNPWQSLSFKRIDSADRRSDSRERPTAERRGSLKDQLNDDVPW